MKKITFLVLFLSAFMMSLIDAAPKGSRIITLAEEIENNLEGCANTAKIQKNLDELKEMGHLMNK